MLPGFAPRGANTVKEFNMDSNTIEKFIQNHPKGHFCQSRLWGKVKSGWQQRYVYTTDADGNLTAAIGFLLRKTPVLPFYLMYAPRGPVCDPGDTQTLTALMNKVRESAKQWHGYLVKLDPDVPVTDTAFIQTLEDCGFSRKNSKNFDAVQPNFVFRLNIEGKNEEEVQALFASKTRYNIRVALKNKVEVTLGSAADLPEFTRIMRVTGERDGFSTRPQSYFEGLLSALGEHARLYIAKIDGKMIAGTIAIAYGDKVWYLYGASDNAFRNAMPNYLLQWEMIRWAIERGCKIYDFRGVSGDLSEDNPLYGLYRFKKGFGGDLVEFAGEFNCVLNPGVDRLVNTGIRLRKKLARHGK